MILWWMNGDKKLPSAAKELIGDASHLCFVSAASVWEIEIKLALGKLSLPDRFYEFLDEQDFVELPIQNSHARAIRSLPLHHKDPFDRLIIAQALIENLTVVTADNRFLQYGIQVA